MSYQLSLHTDTDNLHFHFSFCEKSPNYRCTDNKIKYRNKGKLNEKELNFLKNEILHYINKEKYFTPEMVKLNNEIETLKTFFNKYDKNFLLHDKDDLILENKILELGKLLNQYRGDNNQKIKYGSIKDKEIISLTNEIRRYTKYKNKDGVVHDHVYWVCSSKLHKIDCNKAVTIRDEELKSLFIALFNKFLNNSRNDDLIKKIKTVISTDNSETKILKIDKKMKHVQDKILKLIDLNLNGNIDKDSFVLKNEELNNELNSLKKEKEELNDSQKHIEHQKKI